MSDQFVASAESAKDITAKAASWIERSLHEGWSERDQEKLNAWLAESPAHQIAYWRLESAWSETYRLAAFRSSSSRQNSSQQNAPASGRMLSTIYKAVAAVALLAALGSVAGGYYAKDRSVAYATTLGERKIITLADGSRIELNTDSAVTISLDGAGRKVWLKRGEAFFHVKHDAARPFTVVVANRQIVDIGTEFAVRRNEDALRVAVLEGRVGLGVTGQVNKELASGDVAVARADGVSVTRTPLADIIGMLSWRQGRLVFHHTPLAEAVGEFNRYNSEKIIVADAAAGEITINGTFAMGDARAFARLAHAVLGLHVEDRGQAIILSQK